MFCKLQAYDDSCQENFIKADSMECAQPIKKETSNPTPRKRGKRDTDCNQNKKTKSAKPFGVALCSKSMHNTLLLVATPPSTMHNQQIRTLNRLHLLINKP